jgi:hypothetical protein
VKLEVGKVLLFAPSAMIGVEIDSKGIEMRRLAVGYLQVRVRRR